MKKIIVGLICSFLFSACAAYRIPKNMDPAHKTFLSESRYVITVQERKIFIGLPSSERDAFIEEFWKKRDPDPDTETNEFKEEYYKRIEEANHLFSEGGGHGWLEDRGRIYILLGPPWQREAYPRGMTFYGKPTEIWYYGYFPIVFIDSDWNGTFELDPLSASQLALINKSQMDLKPRVGKEKILFDFTLSFARTGESKGTINLRIPYKNLWFIDEGELLKTALDLSLSLHNSSKAIVWEHKKTYTVNLTEEDLKQVFQDDYLIEVPLTLSGPSGRYTLSAELKNRADELRVQKSIDIEIK